MSGQPPVAQLRADRVFLRPVEPADYPWLRNAELSEDLAFRWRLAGAHPSPEAYAATLWQSVLVQFVICRSSDARPLAIVCAYDYDARNGTARLALARFEHGNGVGALQGAGLMLEYLFSGWPIRKLYLDVPDWNMATIASGLGTLFQEEGRLLQHLFAGGQFHDVVLLALYREVWVRERHRFMPPPSERRATSAVGVNYHGSTATSNPAGRNLASQPRRTKTS